MMTLMQMIMRGAVEPGRAAQLQISKWKREGRRGPGTVLNRVDWK